MPGLYIHVPFCVRHCHYCHFVVTPTGSPDKHAMYLQAIKEESAYCAHAFPRSSFSTVYLGGGTPSALREDEINELFDILEFFFSWDSDAEITCEVNPGEVDASKAALYKKRGINRISLGAQTFHDPLLKRMGRAHSARDIRTVMEIFRQEGFGNISMDLMVALPDQNLEQVSYDLESICVLAPEQICLYDLEIDAGTYFETLRRDNRLSLPTEETRWEMARWIQHHLTRAGYRDYALACYAKPGYESRHNLNYWANGEYVGLGPGAFSYLNHHRFQRSTSHAEYIEKCAAKDWSCCVDDVIEPLRKKNESLLLGLRLKEGVLYASYADILEHLDTDLKKLYQEGLVCQNHGRLALTEKGRYVAEYVFERLTFIY